MWCVKGLHQGSGNSFGAPKRELLPPDRKCTYVYSRGTLEFDLGLNKSQEIHNMDDISLLTLSGRDIFFSLIKLKF